MIVKELKITNSNGDSIEFGRHFRLINGLDLSNLSAINSYSESTRDGANYQRTVLDVREFDLSFFIYNNSRDKWWVEERRRELFRILNPKHNPMRIDFTTKGGEAYYLNANLESVPSLPQGFENDNYKWQKGLLQFTADDPFIYSASSTVVEIASWIGAFEFPLEIPGEYRSYTQVADFEGKVSGSTMENPHIFKRSTTGTNPYSPSEFAFEGTTEEYTRLSKLDGNLNTTSKTVNGQSSKYLFSFNLIDVVERNIGKIPTTDKINWLKDNISKITCYWYGNGSGPNGNKATLVRWNGTIWYTSSAASHTRDSVSMLSTNAQEVGAVTISQMIDSNGFVHLLAYAEPSDGVIPSIINTDYVSLELVLKETAHLNPFEGEGIELGYRSKSLIVNVLNDGDNETGMIIRFRALASLTNPSLINVNTYETFKLNVEMISGDLIEVSTYDGQKTVTLIRNNIRTNIFNTVDLTSTFLQLVPGDNLFRYDAESGLDNLEVSMVFTNRFVGV